MPRRGENIRKRKDGRWEGRYIKNYDICGKAKYVSVYGKSYLEVKQKLIVASSGIDTKTEISKNNNLLFREVLFMWLENNRVKLKSSTYSKYYRIIEKHLVPIIGNTSIRNVNAQYINDILCEKSSNGRLDSCGGLSATYVRTMGFILKAAMVFAQENNYCHALKGTVIMPLKTKSQLKVLSLAEQERLENACCKNSSDKELGIILSLYTGMRLGEVCGLKWEDIDYETNTLHIYHTVERIQNNYDICNACKTKLVLLDTKTANSDRVIPIPSKLMPLLRKEKSGFVLKGDVYEYTDPRTLQYFFKRKLRESNLEDINFHALRHTFATRCIESGMDAKTLSEILGHSDVNITLRTYVHSSLEHKRKQMEAMVAICGQK